MLRRQVVHLGPVSLDVIEFPQLVEVGRWLAKNPPLPAGTPRVVLVGVIRRYQLPPSPPNGSPQRPLIPVQRPRLVSTRFSGKDRQQAATFQRRDLLLADRFRIGRARNVHAGGHDIDDVSHAGGDPASGLDHPGPTGDQRCRDSALVVPPLEVAERRVAEIGPRQIHGPVTLNRTRRNLRCAGAILVAGTVVREEQHQRVLLLTGTAQPPKQPADVPIHPVDHRGIDGHLQVPGVLVINVIPCGRVTVAGWKLQVPIDQAQPFHPLQTFLPQLVPAGQELASVPGDVLRRCVQRVMRHRVSHVQEKRLVLSVGLAEKPKSRIGERVGGVKTPGGGVRLDNPIGDGERLVVSDELLSRLGFTGTSCSGVELVAAPGQQAEIFLETALPWVAGQVPLAGHQRPVPGRPQHLGGWHAPLEPGETDLSGVKAGDQ